MYNIPIDKQRFISLGFGYIHGSGFSCTVVTQESSDLTLVEGDTQTIHSRSRAAAEHLIQVLHTNSSHQT